MAAAARRAAAALTNGSVEHGAMANPITNPRRSRGWGPDLQF